MQVGGIPAKLRVPAHKKAPIKLLEVSVGGSQFKRQEADRCTGALGIQWEPLSGGDLGCTIRATGINGNPSLQAVQARRLQHDGGGWGMAAGLCIWGVTLLKIMTTSRYGTWQDS